MTPRRFPPPWTVIEYAESFWVEDASGQIDWPVWPGNLQCTGKTLPSARSTASGRIEISVIAVAPSGRSASFTASRNAGAHPLRRAGTGAAEHHYVHRRSARAEAMSSRYSAASSYDL
jgi:hypothetical protein